jgi:hypothetical protein
MDKLTPFERPSLRTYRRQRFWQIILPIVLFSFVIVVAGGFTIIADGELNRLWADVSIIWLVAPMLILAIIFLVILVGMIYLLYKLTIGTPHITRKIQNIFIRIEQETFRVSNSIVRPVVWIHQFQSGFNSLARIIRPVKYKGKNYGREESNDTI